MRILLFHPVVLPPRDYGGVERVVLWLAQALFELGNEVWVAARPESVLPTGVRLIPFAEGTGTAFHLIQYLQTRKKEGFQFDVIHFMAPPEKGALELLNTPYLLTVHGNGKPHEQFPLNTVFLSQDHAKRHHAQHFVWNGLNPAEYLFDPSTKKDRFLFLSKTSWKVKNVTGAIKYCTQAKVSLDIAGGSRPFLSRVQAWANPRLNWIGAVNGAKKAELLASACGLVFPVLWPEPFGLVIAEALISGTPVYASSIGSTPELIPADCGSLLNTKEEWVSALSNNKNKFLPHICREYALNHFHYHSMAKKYLYYYSKVVRHECIHEVHPYADE